MQDEGIGHALDGDTPGGRYIGCDFIRLDALEDHIAAAGKVEVEITGGELTNVDRSGTAQFQPV